MFDKNWVENGNTFLAFIYLVTKHYNILALKQYDTYALNFVFGLLRRFNIHERRPKLAMTHNNRDGMMYR